MTVLGNDKPGLVEQLAQVVSHAGGNWLESRFAHLGAQFAGILRVEVPSEQTALLIESVKAIPGLQVVIESESGPDHAAPAKVLELVQLEVIGQDRPGIVRQVAAVISELSVNVEDLSTELISAPMSGEILFKACATLNLPDHLKQDQLLERLESLSGDIMVTIS